MTYKNVLNNVKQLLSMEVKLAQQTLMDGVTTVEAEEFAPDYSIGIVTPDGAIPMPVGEYTLANGDVLVVEVEGVIKSIAPAEVEVEAEKEAPKTEATEPVMAEATAKKVVETVSKETFFAEVENFATINAALKAEIEALKIELASNVPAASIITHNPENVVEKNSFQIASKRERTTEDVVFSKLFKN
jgi:aspartate aminotransferase-like enzyme